MGDISSLESGSIITNFRVSMLKNTFLNLLKRLCHIKKSKIKKKNQKSKNSKNKNYLVFKFVFHHFSLLDFILENFRSQVNRCHSLFRGFIGIPVSVLQWFIQLRDDLKTLNDIFKGQLISKCPFGVSKSPKKPTFLRISALNPNYCC